MFQASGWIEPDPFPIRVTSLYSGVVKKVHVLEGQKIQKDEVIATLIDEDARLVLSEIIAKHSQSMSEEAIIDADIELASAGLSAALSKVTKDQALVQENNDTVNRMSSLSKGAISDQAFYQARLALQRQKAELATSSSEVKQQRALIRKLQETLVAQKKKTEVFSVQKEKAQLDLERTKISNLNLLAENEDLQGSDSEKKIKVASHYHSLTTDSYGVLSDVRTGGLKRDLSHAFANAKEWDASLEQRTYNWIDDFIGYIYKDRVHYLKSVPMEPNAKANKWNDTAATESINDYNAILSGPLWRTLGAFHNMYTKFVSSRRNLGEMDS